MLARGLLGLAVISGCASSNVTGTWLTVEGKEPCKDYAGGPIAKMELSVSRTDDDEWHQDHEYACEERWFDLYLPSGSYWMSVAALSMTTDESLGISVDHLVGSSPALSVVVGDGDVVVAPFLVDVGP